MVHKLGYVIIDKRLCQASRYKDKKIFRIFAKITKMNLKKIRLHISTARIDRYLVATGQNVSKAQRLYKANLKVAQSFYPLLNTLEVVIRNGLNTILSGYFGDFDWIINQKSGFMSHPLLRHKIRKQEK